MAIGKFLFRFPCQAIVFAETAHDVDRLCITYVATMIVAVVGYGNERTIDSACNGWNAINLLTRFRNIELMFESLSHGWQTESSDQQGQEYAFYC